LDTSSFIGGLDPSSLKDTLYTTPTVIEEIRRDDIIKTRLDAALRSRKLKIVMPSSESLQEAKVSSNFMGDSYFLSEVDIQVLALALDLRKAGNDVVIATDDYSIQNVADKMGLAFKPLITFGISRRIHWRRYCPACYKNYPSDYPHSVCQVCGTPLKRKPSRKISRITS